MEKINEIYKTKDYDLFVEMEGNRNISMQHLSRIKSSLESKYIEMPIIVTPSKKHEGKYEVFEGQHRWYALRAMNKEIVFAIIQDLSIEDAILVNTTSKRWQPEDYLSYYIAKGVPSYLELKRFMDLTGLPLGMAKMFVEYAHSRGVIQRNAFQTGTFEFDNFEGAYELYLKHLDYEQLESFRKSIFKLAVIKVLNHHEYNHERMKSKLAQIGYKIGNRANTTDYLTAFTEVYNYNAGKENRVFFNLE